MMSAYRVAFWLILLLIFLPEEAICHERLSSMVHGNRSVDEEMVPLIEGGKMEMVMMNDTRRRLRSFQVCALCTCCGGARGRVCLPSPCCYAINCNIPNRPFGFCSFTPKTCNCFGCHI